MSYRLENIDFSYGFSAPFNKTYYHTKYCKSAKTESPQPAYQFSSLIVINPRHYTLSSGTSVWTTCPHFSNSTLTFVQRMWNGAADGAGAAVYILEAEEEETTPRLKPIWVRNAVRLELVTLINHISRRQMSPPLKRNPLPRCLQDQKSRFALTKTD